MNCSLQQRAGDQLCRGSTVHFWGTVPGKHCLPHTLHYSTADQLKFQCYALVPSLRDDPHVAGHYRGDEIIAHDVTRIGVALEYLQQKASMLFAVF